MNILYITFGPTRFHLQARLSILSALNYCAPAHICVLTDSPESYSSLGVRTINLTQSLLKQFRGPMNFHHRVKVAGIQYYDSFDSGPFVYVDSDTYWLRNPLDIATFLLTDNYLMERFEGKISDSYFPRLHRFLTSQRNVLSSEGFGFTSRQTGMYIAGLIGFPSSNSRASLLRSVLNFTDFLTLHFSEQMEWVEQYAFSSILAERCLLETAEGFVNHYWNCNTEVQILLTEVKPSALTDIARSIDTFEDLLSRAKLLQHDPKHKRFLRKRKHIRSFKKRLSILRAFFLRNFSRSVGGKG